MVDMAVRAMSCCCIGADQTDAHQLTTFPGGNPNQDELASRPLQLPSSSAGQFGRPPSRLDPLESAMLSSRTSGSAPLTARSLNSERQKEKERLQDMVKEFAKAAVQGQLCQWLPGTTGTPRAATYSFDKALRNFHVIPEGSQPLTLEMTRITDILKEVRGTPFSEMPRLPPPHALAGEEIDRRFVCVQYQGSDQTEFLGLLLPNPHERERFFTCMKILRWAMESRRERQ